MTVDLATLVGREAELERLGAFLGDRHALPAVMVIEGSAGAGKTTLWRAGVDMAAVAGYLVLSCRPAGSEVQMSHAALSDLLEPRLDDVLSALPSPQRRALEVALLLSDVTGDAPDRRAIAAGVLSAVRALARERPLLIAIDDAQWLDRPSAEAVEFALRRLRGEAVAVLATMRTDSSTVRPEGLVRGLRLERALDRPPSRMEAEPLSLGATHRLLRTRTGLVFNRRTLQRIHETSRGNPFYALELARAMEHAGEAASARSGTAEPLRLSAGLTDLLAERVRGLSARTRDALFVASALTQPAIAVIGATIDSSDEATMAVLAPAAAASIIRLGDGSVEFVHPLLAAAAYASKDQDERRRWHARIAEAATDPETMARHLALAHPGQDEAVATGLHAAARHAIGRGAPGVAAELFAEAIDRLPGDGAGRSVERGAWIVEATPFIAAAGAADRARALLEPALVDLPPGPIRADALLHLARLVESDAGGVTRAVELIDASIAEAGTDARRLAAALLDREMWERSQAGLEEALPIARRALQFAEQADDEHLLAEAHVCTADLDVLLGLGGEPVARFQRALELDKRVHVVVESSAPVMLAVCLIRAARLDEARVLLVEGRLRAIAEGDEASLEQICMFLAELEWLAGRWDVAAAYAAEGLEAAQQAGLRMREGGSLAMVALVEASSGDPDRARELAVRARAICDEVGDIGYANYARQVLAFIELSMGNAAAANEHLESYLIGRSIEGPKRIAFVGDAIEALVLLGEADRAAQLIDEVGRRGALLHRSAMLATAARCRSLVLAGGGALDDALRSAGEAVAILEGLGLPFEHARALLVLGEVQRRAKQRRAARDTLTKSLAAFDRLGARLWSSRAAAERARVGGRSTIEGLSETEARVAGLVAEGKSNKEVAAELFVSVRAVEANLSKVYAKLGIRSRTELARRI